MKPAKLALPLAPLLILATLAGCTQGPKPKLYCPKVAVLSQASHLTRSSGGQENMTPDIAHRILDARITGVAGSCETAGKHQARLTFRIGFAASTGPAATAPSATLSYFIALTQGQRIIDKKLYPVTFDFPNGAPEAVTTTAPIKIVFPNAPRSAGQQVLVGFQLTPAELKQQQ